MGTSTKPSADLFTVVIADDDPTIRQTLAELLEDHPGMSVVGSADNGIAAAEMCERLHADLAVLDVMMPSGGLDALKAVRAAAPETVIAFYTAMSDRRARSRLIDAGAAAVFAKGAAVDLAGELHNLLLRPH